MFWNLTSAESNTSALSGVPGGTKPPLVHVKDYINHNKHSFLPTSQTPKTIENWEEHNVNWMLGGGNQ